jgi:hypothetical protein
MDALLDELQRLRTEFGLMTSEPFGRKLDVQEINRLFAELTVLISQRDSVVQLGRTERSGIETMTAVATVTGKFRRAPVPRLPRSAGEIGRASVEFDGGVIVLLTRNEEMVRRFSEIGTGSTVEVHGRLRERHWRIGSGTRSELQLEPTAVTVLHDARRERMLGV